MPAFIYAQSAFLLIYNAGRKLAARVFFVSQALSQLLASIRCLAWCEETNLYKQQMILFPGFGAEMNGMDMGPTGGEQLFAS